MENSEKPTLEEGSPDQQETELELESGTTPTQGGDPLDEITDIEELRSEAKKIRAIDRRKAKRALELPKEEEVNSEAAPSDYLMRGDFEKLNQKKAISMATEESVTDSDEAKALKADMLDNWEEIRQFYTPRRGKDSAENIFEDIKDAHAVFNTRRPSTEDKPDTTDLTSTKTTGTGSAKKVKAKKESKLNIKKPQQPGEWY